MTGLECSLSILVARTDVRFILHTVPHIVRACAFPFAERVLVVDTAPISGFYRSRRTGVGSIKELRECCDRLYRQGVVDRITEIDYSPSYRRAVYTKHFGRDLRFTHDAKGYPILGSIFAVEEARFDYVVHSDSDMLIHQRRGSSWVERGISLLRDHDDVMFVMPRAGPPTQNGDLPGQRHSYERDRRGFYRFKNFTSRLYLVDSRRLERLLPLPLLQRGGPRRRLWRALWRQSSLESWERMVTRQMQESPYVRADLDGDDSWTLHPPDHGSEYVAALPELIQHVEAGRFPSDQAGYYDLKMELYA